LLLLVLVLCGGLFSFFCNVFSPLLTAGCQSGLQIAKVAFHSRS
jgi:hypothetical protein